jgi:radical SAM superfamily enzyme YgiQ (UPF0313 family)
MRDDDVCLLAESGVSHIGFGTESASQHVLKLMNKHHQNVEQMVQTARKAYLAGIRVTFNVILGYPGETETDPLNTRRRSTHVLSPLPPVGTKHANLRRRLERVVQQPVGVQFQQPLALPALPSRQILRVPWIGQTHLDATFFKNS